MTVPGFPPPASQRYSHASVIPNAKAEKKANKPSATRWPADEYSVELDSDAVVVVLEEFAEVGAGVAVAAAPTPPVTGPLSEI